MRHGESEGNLDDTIYERVPDHRISLTPKGFEQARQTGVVIREVLGGSAAPGSAGDRAASDLERTALLLLLRSATTD